MFAQGEKSFVTYENITSKVTEYDILSFYLGSIEVPSVINSPLREDKNPSFGLYSPNGIVIRFTDLKTKERGGTFDLLQRYWGLSYKEALQKVAEDLPLIKRKDNDIKPFSKSSMCRASNSPRTNLECKVRTWKDYDLQYWDSYGISKSMLDYCEVFPVSAIFVTKDGYRRRISAEKYAYVYVERKDLQVTLKIYQPYSIKYKWCNNHNSSVWSLWSKLPETGDILIITSSTKDAMCIMDNTGIPSVALQGEGYTPKEHVVNQLKDRFKQVFVLYDNDYDKEENHGKILGEQFSTLFGVKQLEIPKIYQSKDTSDLAKNNGREIVKKVIFNLINS